MALGETLVELEVELSKQVSKFLRPSSESPHLGDLAVFGVLKGLEGLPIWKEIFKDNNSRSEYPEIRRWYAIVDKELMKRKLRTQRL